MSFTKVIQGKITETHFKRSGDKFIEDGYDIFHQGQVIIDGHIEAHELSNESPSIAVTLHIEMPPMQKIPIQKDKIIVWRKP